MKDRLSKKNGEKRQIEEPNYSQKEKQKEIIDKLKSNGEFDFKDFNYSMKGPRKAVKKFEEVRDNGFQWIAKLDVKSCFPSIDPNDAFSLIDCEVEGVPEITSRDGLPQGHPLSNYLAEVYLDQFDTRVNHWPDNGCKVIRYVDDIWLMCKKKREVEVHLKFAVRYLNDLDLHIHSSSDSKASVKHVNEGVEVLGFVIDRRTKRPLPEKVREHKEELISLILGALGSNSESSTQENQFITVLRSHPRVQAWSNYYGQQYIQELVQWIREYGDVVLGCGQ